MSLYVHILRNAKPRKMKSVRLDQFEIRNQTSGLYYTVTCKTINGVAVLCLSDAGKS